MPIARLAACTLSLVTLSSYCSAAFTPMDILTPNENAAIQAEDSGLRERIERFRADSGSLGRLYSIDLSPTRRERMRAFYQEWLDELRGQSFAKLSFDAQVDHILLRNHLQREIRTLELEEKEQSEIAALVPFASIIIELQESRKRMERVDSEKAAATLNELAKTIKDLKGQVGDELKADKFDANRASSAVRSLRETLRDWFNYFNGYDPMFTWWVSAPHKAVDDELQAYGNALREKLVGVKPEDQDTIVGNPIGEEALMAELQFEMIPYTPQQLIAIAEREYAWCEAEMKNASRELGFGEDWKKALEHVKTLHVEPGEQTHFVRDLALEAIEFVKSRDLVTVPPLAEETWRMEMMTPERQRVNPFFLGGETIIVSFPTHTMTHDEKLMSMRGNNRHFSRAVAHHELIPGHHLQQFMNQRYRPYRSLFRTPFWTEGWALWWEMLLWDNNFPEGPEDKVGMLYWRMHRCARIVFSLNFHLGNMTPEECIDYLVEKVGHERNNAEGEVRRSFNGSYGPLYQLAYMIGGLQFRALHTELVKSGKMTNRQFHDAILHENHMPVEMVRAVLTRQKLSPDFRSSWRFAN